MQEHEIHRNVYVMYIMYVQSMYMVSGQGLGQVMCMRVLRAVLYDPCLFSKESITTPTATNQYITTYVVLFEFACCVTPWQDSRRTLKRGRTQARTIREMDIALPDRLTCSCLAMIEVLECSFIFFLFLLFSRGAPHGICSIYVTCVTSRIGWTFFTTESDCEHRIKTF